MIFTKLSKIDSINDIKKTLSFDCIHAIIITSVEGPLCLR